MTWVKKYWYVVLVAVAIIAGGLIYYFNHNQTAQVDTTVVEATETIAPMADLVE